MQKKRLRYIRQTVHYGIIIVTHILILGIKLSFPDVLGPTPFLMMLFLVIISALLGNLWTGIASAIFTSLIANFYYIQPSFSFETSVPELIQTTMHLLQGLIVSWLIHKQKRALVHNQQLGKIIESSHEAIISLDFDGIITTWNKGADLLYGFAASEMIGTSITKIIPDEKINDAKKLLNRIKKGDIVSNFETQRINQKGNLVYVSISYSPIIDNGHIVGASTIARDITKQKQLEQALRQANEDLEAKVADRTKELRHINQQLQTSNRELQDFAHVASHDLQEPLRKIQSFGNLLKDEYHAHMTSEEQLYIDRMLESAGRMRRLIEGLLSFARVTSKAAPFKKVPLNGIMNEVVSNLEVRINDAHAQVDVGRLPTIDADPLQMQQLFQNLLSNSLKFHQKDKPPHITISTDTASPHGKVTIKVKDNGIGIDQKYSERIFRIFERLHSKDEYEGTGVGLAIVRKIVERHHGSVSISSESGEGTTFKISLPKHQINREREGNYDSIQ